MQESEETKQITRERNTSKEDMTQGNLVGFSPSRVRMRGSIVDGFSVSLTSAMSVTLFSVLVLCLVSTAFSKVDPMHGVLGFSSGAYFAVQYQLSFSSNIRGAAIFAGGPYYCMLS